MQQCLRQWPASESSIGYKKNSWYSRVQGFFFFFWFLLKIVVSEFASRVWPHIELTHGSLYEYKNPPFFIFSQPAATTTKCPPPQIPPQKPNKHPTPLLCQAVVAASVASSVTGEVPCYSSHRCSLDTLRLCSPHQWASQPDIINEKGHASTLVQVQGHCWNWYGSHNDLCSENIIVQHQIRFKEGRKQLLSCCKLQHFVYSMYVTTYFGSIMVIKSQMFC